MESDLVTSEPTQEICGVIVRSPLRLDRWLDIAIFAGSHQTTLEADSGSYVLLGGRHGSVLGCMGYLMVINNKRLGECCYPGNTIELLAGQWDPREDAELHTASLIVDRSIVTKNYMSLINMITHVLRTGESRQMIDIDAIDRICVAELMPEWLPDDVTSVVYLYVVFPIGLIPRRVELLNR